MWYIPMTAMFCMGSLFANDIDILVKECNSNNSLNCLKLSVLYYKGLDVKQDYTKAKELYINTCDLKEALSLILGIYMKKD